MSAIPSWSLRLCEGLYAALLRLYPEPFRQAWGAEMRRIFRDCCQAGWQRGGWARLAGELAPLLFDGLRSSLAEWLWPTRRPAAPALELARRLEPATRAHRPPRPRIEEAAIVLRMNLLPIEPRFVLPLAYRHLSFGSVLAVLALSCIGLVYSQTTTQQFERSDEARRKEMVAAQLERVIHEVSQFKRARADLEEKLDTIQRLRDDQKGPLRLLTELRDKFPRQVWLQSLRYSRGRVQMRGHGLTLTSVGELIEGLKRSRHFSDIDLQRSLARLASGQQVYAFELSLRFDPDPERTARDLERKARAKAQAKARKKPAKRR